MTPGPRDRSYRALLAVPNLGRIIVSMQVARVAQSMVGVAIVLFALTEYRSPALAGLVTFVSLLPGLLVSPIAGALLDRHGRTRLIILDYLVALGALVLIGGLSLAGLLPAWLLVVIATVSSLTLALSQTGLRSLFPIIVPRHLWERVNAFDSNGYVLATIVGPPLAAGLVATVGGATTLVLIGLVYGVATLAILGVPDPPTTVSTSGRLLVDAWHGLRYVWRNPTLRGLGFSIATLNLTGGVTTIVVPLIVLERLGYGEATVGLVWAVSGVAGVISTFTFGRIDSHGREWLLLVLPMLVYGPIVGLMLLAAGTPDPVFGILIVAASLALGGLLTGPLDIGLFTIRQRRTDPAWMGRGFAVSMAFNYLGYPIGAAIAGVLAGPSLEAAIVLGVAASMLATVFAAFLVPRSIEEPESSG